MTDTDQLMRKMRLRRLLAEMLDSEILQLDLEEDYASPGEGTRVPVKRINLVARYIPA
jgi:hypothetical protein